MNRYIVLTLVGLVEVFANASDKSRQIVTIYNVGESSVVRSDCSTSNNRREFNNNLVVPVSNVKGIVLSSDLTKHIANKVEILPRLNLKLPPVYAADITKCIRKENCLVDENDIITGFDFTTESVESLVVESKNAAMFYRETQSVAKFVRGFSKMVFLYTGLKVLYNIVFDSLDFTEGSVWCFVLAGALSNRMRTIADDHEQKRLTCIEIRDKCYAAYLQSLKNKEINNKEEMFSEIEKAFVFYQKLGRCPSKDVADVLRAARFQDSKQLVEALKRIESNEELVDKNIPNIFLNKVRELKDFNSEFSCIQGLLNIMTGRAFKA